MIELRPNTMVTVELTAGECAIIDHLLEVVAKGHKKQDIDFNDLLTTISAAQVVGVTITRKRIARAMHAAENRLNGIKARAG